MVDGGVEMGLGGGLVGVGLGFGMGWARLPSSCHVKNKQYCGPTALRLAFFMGYE